MNSDESLALSYQGTSQFSKSPSSDGSLASEDRFLSLHEELYNLSKEEREITPSLFSRDKIQR